MTRLSLVIITLSTSIVFTVEPPSKTPAGPLTPKDEQATFRVAKGFSVELVACEPDIVDPVSMCIDERGRLFVCEMRGYPNGGVGTGIETRGKIRCLTDNDGDGVFETTHTFAEGLRFPMGLQPWKGGLLVAVAPDLLYLEDTDGDGKADKSTKLYTGFNQANIQQMLNSLQWGLDNWVYGCAGSDDGTVKSAQIPNAAEVQLRNRGLRFHPDIPASLEPTSGGGQYGLTADDAQHWFTATNSQHLRQIILPDCYIRRNPFLPISAVTLDIPEHGAAARVYRISPFEQWRVERTSRRAGSADAKRYPTTELVPGGYITSACSPLIYTADLFPESYRGNNFVCDPANNLIHREVLVDKGAIFSAKRVDTDVEFLASTDNWFRPVHLTLGPDGAIYVLDFYREVIETPLSLPDDIKSKLNLESRGRGRIWRIVPTGYKPTKLADFSQYTGVQLVDELLSSNSARRITAQRLIIERREKDISAHIRKMLTHASGKTGYANLLWTLHGIGELAPEDLLPAYNDAQPGTREQALRLSEAYLSKNIIVQSRVSKLVDDPSPRVRFQLALSAGYLPTNLAAVVLGTLLEKDSGDHWIETAALISAANSSRELIIYLAPRKIVPTTVLTKLAAICGARADNDEIVTILELISNGLLGRSQEAALLEGLGQGMRNSKHPLAIWWKDPPANARLVMMKLRGHFEKAAQILGRADSAITDRVASAGLLAFGPFDIAGPALFEALSPSSPNDLQLVVIRSLSAHTDPKVTETLLNNWATYTPSTRREVLDVVLSRPDRTLKLLNAIEKKQIAVSELDPQSIKLLKTYPDPVVRNRSELLLKNPINPDRIKVVSGYATATNLKANVAKGKEIFKTRCMACHKLDGLGHEVGPNLLAGLPNKSAEDLMIAILDPNREVDPRYVSYQVITSEGRVLVGLVSVETPTSVTLRRAEGAEDIVLRNNVEIIRSTKISLMPEGFEKQLSQQDMADLLAYLKSVGK